MSNLLKSFYTHQTDERVIDYNEVISNKIESFKSRMQTEPMEADGFVSGINAAIVEELIGEDGEPMSVIGGDVQDDDPLSALVSDGGVPSGANQEELKFLAENIISDADMKASQIIEEARNEAERIKNDAYTRAHEDGLRDGYEEGAAKAQEEYQKLINDANSELERLEVEYNKRRDAMESELVDTLVEVFAKITNTIAEDNKDIVLHLINQVMNNVEATGDFLIRVSKEDYPFLIENQGKIYLASPKDINLSIIEDSELTVNQCIIETEGGVFDCSLDIQLEQLIHDIKLLSCMSN